MDKNRPVFTFDGFGINGPDEYRSRLATLTLAGHNYPGLGPMLAAVPAMLEALKAAESMLVAVLNGSDDSDDINATLFAVREAIAKTQNRSN